IEAYLLDSFLNSSKPVLTYDEMIGMYQEFNIRYQKENKQKTKELREYNNTIETDEEHKKHDARREQYFTEAKRKLAELDVEVKEHASRDDIKQLINEYPKADPKNDCKRRAV